MRRAMALAAGLVLAAAVPAAGQEPTYTLADLEARCEASADFAADACLAVLYVFIFPELGIESPIQPAPAVLHDEPVTRTGEGFAQTEAFDLSGGDYRVESTARAGDLSDCSHHTDLVSLGGTVDENAGSVHPTIDSVATAESYVYGIPAGRYYLDLISGCEAWSVTIEPA